MIRDLITYLKTDATLANLLYANAGNGKFFPMITDKPKGERTPYILYKYSTTGSSDPVIDERIVQLSVIEQDYDNAQEICYRLDELLDVYDKLHGKVASIKFYIYYGHNIGGNDGYEQDTKICNLVRLFNIKYKRKNGG